MVIDMILIINFHWSVFSAIWTTIEKFFWTYDFVFIMAISLLHQVHRLLDKIYFIFSSYRKNYCTGVFQVIFQAFDRVSHTALHVSYIKCLILTIFKDSNLKSFILYKKPFTQSQ